MSSNLERLLFYLCGEDDEACAGLMRQLAQTGSYRLTPEQALTAVTLNGAAAICRADRIGSIEPGKQADILIWNAEDLDYICYRLGSNLVDTVIKKGNVV